VSSIILSEPYPFEQEFCDRHTPVRQASLVFSTLCGTYRWRCASCGIGWVTVGSAMDIANEIAFANCCDRAE